MWHLQAGDGLDNGAGGGSEYSGSDTSFFKRMGKKKRPPVQPIDFDELFARGHALSAQLEGGSQVWSLNHFYFLNSN